MTYWPAISQIVEHKWWCTFYYHTFRK